jgi:ubiquinone/menaquinone biosynthesis C-methylase UbiE
MNAQFHHALLPDQTHDEAGREGFIQAMRRFITVEMSPANRRIFARELQPAFAAKTGRVLEDREEVRQAARGSRHFRFHALLERATQELLWDTVGESVERQLPQLVDRARPRNDSLGSVRVDPNLPLPHYYTGIDIHVMPGNFHTELGPGDVFAGALYDRGVYIFSFGTQGELNDSLGRLAAQIVRDELPDATPRRILDMGCGIGFSTVPLVDAFPEAEVHGVDLGAPMVRYAHGRAESLGREAHFSQQNATQTDFPDGSFDVVVSALLLHEVPQQVAKSVIAECYRLLAPGGTMFHLDSFNARAEPFEIYYGERHQLENHEPFIGGNLRLDWEAACTEAGFAPGSSFVKRHKPAHMAIPLQVRGATKA